MALRLATRPSKLALAQAAAAERAFRESGLMGEIHLVPVSTRGDLNLSIPLGQPGPGGGRGVFTDAVEEALRCHEADIAVHSAKDMSCRDAADLFIAGALIAGLSEDVWLTRDGTKFEEAPKGWRVGTSSVRRAHQIRSVRGEDLVVVPLRGNVDTRIKKLTDGEIDAIILAAAGLDRLGLLQSESLHIHRLSTEVFLPAPCQGLIALQVRRGDEAALRAVRSACDSSAWHRLIAERACADGFGADCSQPVAVFSEINGGSMMIRVRARFYRESGEYIEAEDSGRIEEACDVGRRTGENLRFLHDE